MSPSVDDFDNSSSYRTRTRAARAWASAGGEALVGSFITQAQGAIDRQAGRAQSTHFDRGLTAGLVDSEAYGDVGFLSAQIGLAN